MEALNGINHKDVTLKIKQHNPVRRQRQAVDSVATMHEARTMVDPHNCNFRKVVQDAQAV